MVVNGKEDYEVDAMLRHKGKRAQHLYLGVGPLQNIIRGALLTTINVQSECKRTKQSQTTLQHA